MSTKYKVNTTTFKQVKSLKVLDIKRNGNTFELLLELELKVEKNQAKEKHQEIAN